MTNATKATQFGGQNREAATAEQDKGLSMYHISPQGRPTKRLTKRLTKSQKPRIIVWKGANLVSVEMGKLKGTKGKRHDWTRGIIKKFSKGSRRRVLRLVAKLLRIAISAFVTLTYPDAFERDPQKVKIHLDNFFKRLIRKFPSAVVLWRLEPQKRKSGKNKGEIAPHFHLLVWNVDYVNLLKWIPANWYEVVNSGDEKHLKAGTSVERVRSSKGVLYYTAKYICKSNNYELEGWGRYWGVVNRELLKTIQAKPFSFEIDEQTAITLLRYMRHKASEVYIKGEFSHRRNFPKWGQKFTLIGNADNWEIIAKITQNPKGYGESQRKRFFSL